MQQQRLPLRLILDAAHRRGALSPPHMVAGTCAMISALRVTLTLPGCSAFAHQQYARDEIRRRPREQRHCRGQRRHQHACRSVQHGQGADSSAMRGAARQRARVGDWQLHRRTMRQPRAHERAGAHAGQARPSPQDEVRREHGTRPDRIGYFACSRPGPTPDGQSTPLGWPAADVDQHGARTPVPLREGPWGPPSRSLWGPPSLLGGLGVSRSDLKLAS